MKTWLFSCLLGKPCLAHSTLKSREDGAVVVVVDPTTPWANHLSHQSQVMAQGCAEEGVPYSPDRANRREDGAVVFVGDPTPWANQWTLQPQMIVQQECVGKGVLHNDPSRTQVEYHLTEISTSADIDIWKADASNKQGFLEDEEDFALKSLSYGKHPLDRLMLQLHQKGAQAQQVKETRHKSIVGHNIAMEFFQDELGMTLLSHEERFFIPEMYEPDMIFSWKRAEGHVISVFCEVKQHPPYNSGSQSRKNYKQQRNAKLKKLRQQCVRGYELLGHDSCCFVGLFQEQAHLRVIICLGDSSQVLLHQLATLGRRYGRHT